MKKYLQAIPIIIYPYILCTLIFIVTSLDIKMDVTLYTYFAITIIYTILLLIFKLKDYSEKDITNVNLAIKLFQLPWFFLCLMLELLGLFMGIFGIPIIIILAMLNISVRITSGIYSIRLCH